MRKSGFTLVELSIVLVIIGLLIGGILVAQSMIGTARISSQISQISQFDIAVNNFKTKYLGLPGDVSRFDGGGNGNGILENSAIKGGATVSTTNFDDEIAQFWRHLSLDGFTPDKVIYSQTATNGIKAKINIPAGVFKNSAILPVSYTNYVAAPYYYLCDFTASTSPAVTGAQGLLTPADAYAIDLKLDDGIAYSGDIANYGGSVRAAQLTPNNCWASNRYTVSNTEKTCCINISIGSVTGTKN